jgi:hypothetical protein
MASIKRYTNIFLLLLLLMPAFPVPCHAQSNTAEEDIVSIQDDTEGKKKKKNKDKDKDDTNFYELRNDKLSDKFFVRLAINVGTVIILICLIYFPTYRKREFFFTFFVFNIIIFLITYLLNKVDMSLGAAFGLFAVFSMLRYRTEGISAKEMTYLFLVIAIGLLTAVSKGTFWELTVINLFILLFTYILEGNHILKKEYSKNIEYENIEMIKPENEKLLIEDLQRRTGLDIHRIAIGKIDFLKDTASVKAYYFIKGHHHS